MRVLIVGAGGISYRHAAACRALEGVELVGVCDVRPEAANKLADEHGVAKRYPSVASMLADASADLAIVSTWGANHAETCAAIARSRRVRGILCEKPLAMNAAEAAEMARVAAEQGVLLAEAFRLRHQPIHHRAIELIRDGRIGEVVHVRDAMMSVRAPELRRPELDWRFNKAAGGGVTYDIGCYCINHVRWAMGAEPETVQAFGRWGEVSGVDEHVLAAATFPGGRTAEWCVSWHAGPRHVAEVIGSKGLLRIENAWGDRAQTATRLEVVDASGREVLEFEPREQFGLQLAHMRDALEAGVPHRVPPSDSVAQMRAIDAVYASLRSGQPARVGQAAPAGYDLPTTQGEMPCRTRSSP